MERVRGNVLHCSRFGCIVRLEDGRLATFPATERGIDTIRRAQSAGRHPQFPFVVTEDTGRRVRLALPAQEKESAAPSSGGALSRFSSSLEQKIIDFWRQTSEWDRNAGRVDAVEPQQSRPDRLLPFEARARSQYRESPKRARRPKR